MSHRNDAPPATAASTAAPAAVAPAVPAVGATDAAAGPAASAVTSAAAVPADDHDSPWKEALELFFRQAIELLAHALYQVIDWSVAPQFLDKELQALGVPDGPPGHGRLHADKLVRVRHKDGADAWILVHVEVQGGGMGARALSRIAQRMYRYRTRIEHRHEGLNARAERAPPALFSLAILVASRSGPERLEYRREFLGQGVYFSFHAVHLSQWLSRWSELESLARTNPFAVVIMAQLQALRYRTGAQRLEPTVSLVRLLYGYGYDREHIQPLLRLIEWMLRLPAQQEPAYLAAVERLEQERKMSYVMIAERRGIAKGLEQGQVKGQADLLLRLIERRFGRVDAETTQRIRAAGAPELEAWSLNILDAPTLDEIFRS